MGEVDQMRRLARRCFIDRDQRVAAGDHLGVLVLGQEVGRLANGPGAMVI